MSNSTVLTIINHVYYNFRVEHQKLHEKHKGHEKMHAEMVLILILTLVVAQVVLIEWKKRHYKSYSVIPDQIESSK